MKYKLVLAFVCGNVGSFLLQIPTHFAQLNAILLVSVAVYLIMSYFEPKDDNTMTQNVSFTQILLTYLRKFGFQLREGKNNRIVEHGPYSFNVTLPDVTQQEFDKVIDYLGIVAPGHNHASVLAEAAKAVTPEANPEKLREG